MKLCKEEWKVELELKEWKYCGVEYIIKFAIDTVS